METITLEKRRTVEILVYLLIIGKFVEIIVKHFNENVFPLQTRGERRGMFFRERSRHRLNVLSSKLIIF